MDIDFHLARGDYFIPRLTLHLVLIDVQRTVL